MEDIYHCDYVVKEALGAYLSKCKREGDMEGHFIRRSSDIKSYLVSKAVDSSHIQRKVRQADPLYMYLPQNSE